MATVKILVKGIALTYHKNDGLWRVLFPWEGGHLIKFKETEEEQGMALARTNRGIRIKTKGAESRFEAGPNYDDFLDMTADYSHKNGVKMKEGWQEKAVLMTVENAKFSVNEVTIDEHFLHLDNVVTLAPRQIGYDGVMEIRAEKVIVEVDEHADFPMTFTEDCTLIFDNDCHETRELSDFAMLYDIIEDADNPNLQFTSAKYTDEITGTLAAGAVLQSDERVALRNNTTEGLPCNLVSASQGDALAPDDPEVTLRNGTMGNIGLPCHLVTASKTDSLPEGTTLDPEQDVTLRNGSMGNIGLPCYIVTASKTDALPAGTTLDPEQGVTLRTSTTEGLPCNVVRASNAELLPAGTILDPEEGITLRDSMDSGLPCHIVRVSKTDALPAGTILDPEQGVTLRENSGGHIGVPCHLVKASKADLLPAGTTLDPEEGVTLRNPKPGGGGPGLPCHLVRVSNADLLPEGTALDPEDGVILRSPNTSGGGPGFPCYMVRASKMVELP